MRPSFERLEDLERHVRVLEQQSSTTLRRLQWWRRLALVLLTLGVFTLPLSLRAAPAEKDEKLPKGLPQRVLALERKLQHVTSVHGPDGFPELILTGANLRIVNGLGRTNCGPLFDPIPGCPNGLGNLIVGYNEPREVEGAVLDPIRTGSHNIVVGEGHDFSSFGGLVVGFFNTISGEFASVSGGSSNTASGLAAAVSGGFGNTASDDGASVSGGSGNTASEDGASVSGGFANTASGFGASVSGGESNTASGFTSASVSGGRFNLATGDFSSISGGTNRMAEGEFDWVAGGLFQDQ
jgi:hypothetical protein